MDDKLFKALDANLKEAVKVAKGTKASKSVYVVLTPAEIRAILTGVGMSQSAFATLIPSGHVPVGRWTKSLTELSGVSTKHAKVVRDLVEGLLRHDPSDPPRDIGGLIELLYELSAALDTPLADNKALDYLRGVTGGGKLKQFAGKLLARADITPR